LDQNTRLAANDADASTETSLAEMADTLGQALMQSDASTR
jgi:hypothetical protein